MTAYALGYSEGEQDRLIRQAILLGPTTERLFREAGICAGQRVLDIGSGLGDVSMIAAGLVGSSGEIVGIELDAGYVARARERVAAAGFRHVTFIHADVTDIRNHRPFDAVVGRLVLNHCPDPVAVLRSLSQLVVPGGVIAFQEGAWSPTLAASARVPLWSRLVTAIRETLARSGTNPEVGLDLYRLFQDAGLPAPHMHLDMPLTADSSVAELEADLLRALRSATERHGVSLEELGDLDSLPARIVTEATAARSVIPFLAMVSAWPRKAVQA
jgi:SAM-dependent methyltransferase